MKSPFTNRGSNQGADDWHAQKVDREREAAELTGWRLAFLEKSERELIAKLIEYYEAGDRCCAYKTEKYEAICDVPESTFNKLRESIK